MSAREGQGFAAFLQSIKQAGGSVVAAGTIPAAAPVSELADEIAAAEANAGELAEVPFSLTPTHERRTPHTRGLF